MTERKRILFVNNAHEKCGVFQYGLNIYNALKKTQRYQIDYAECANRESFTQAVKKFSYWAVIYNYHDVTLSFIDPITLKKHPKIIHISLAHELTQELIDEIDGRFFDYYIYADPTLIASNPRIFKIGRLVPQYENKKPLPEIVTIGSYGFAGKLKQFEYLIELVQKEFDHAIIRINISPHDVQDKDASDAKEYARRCEKKIYKPGVKLRITHEFFTHEGLLDFLAQNTINVFPYAECGGTGISSAIDQALAVRRPFAISNCFFFRHLFAVRPSVVVNRRSITQFLLRLKDYKDIVGRKIHSALFDKNGFMFLFNYYVPSFRLLFEIFIKSKWNLETNSLKAIIKNGIAPLEEFRSKWSESNLIAELEHILEKIELRYPKKLNNQYEFNRILDDSSRIEYESSIQELKRLAPKIIAKKIPRANVQQAFVFDAVKAFINRQGKILCVGGFEDTACYALQALGYPITNIDPVLNGDLNTFFHGPNTVKGSYDLVFSTSVIEHVEDDLLFFSQIVELMKPGAVGIFTCDFKDSYRKGDPLFPGNFRFYTARDLHSRILVHLKGCHLVDLPKWDQGEHDFELGGQKYTFATLVFRKNHEKTIGDQTGGEAAVSEEVAVVPS